MLIEKDYCDYETRNELIKLGYPAHLYDNTEVDKILGVILLYEAQKWLREEKEIYVSVVPEYNEFGLVKGVVWRLEVIYWKDDEFGYETIEWLNDNYTVSCFDDYEEALSEGIKEAVKILKEE